MESANESTDLLSKTEMPPSSDKYDDNISIEKQYNNISILMGERSHLQVLTIIASTDSVYHLIYIITLFFCSTVLWKHAHLSSRANQPLYRAIHTNLDNVQTAEVGLFFFIFTLRQVYDTYTAVNVEETWMRREERGTLRKLAFTVLIGNVIITTFFIFWPALAGEDTLSPILVFNVDISSQPTRQRSPSSGDEAGDLKLEILTGLVQNITTFLPTLLAESQKNNRALKHLCDFTQYETTLNYCATGSKSMVPSKKPEPNKTPLATSQQTSLKTFLGYYENPNQEPTPQRDTAKSASSMLGMVGAVVMVLLLNKVGRLV
ncbi:hypothetical protein BDR22DRAFT_891763 [Usnea florida]